jgi:hypothetical protein
MSISNRGRRPASWLVRSVRSGQPRAASAPRASWRSHAWLTVTALISVTVFIGFWAQTTLPMAAVMAMAILLAGGILVTLVSGTTWITQLRHLITGSRR